MERQMDDLFCFLRNTKAKDLSIRPTPGDVKWLFHHDTIGHALHTFWRNRIFSCPVYSREEGKFTRMLTLGDIILHIATSFNREELNNIECDALSELGRYYAYAVERKESNLGNKLADFLSAPVGELAKFPVLAVDKDVDLLTTLHSWIKTNNVHRLVVLRRPTKIHSVISGWEIAHWCYYNRGKIPKDILKRTLGNLDMGRERDICLSGENTVLEAIRLMHQERVTGVGILSNNNEKKLIGNFGVGDMKFLLFHHKTLANLHMPLRDYLSGRTQRVSKHYKPVCKLVTLRPDATFKHLMRSFVETRAKRIYLVDNNERFIAALTPGDILRTVWKCIESCENFSEIRLERLGLRGDEEKIQKKGEERAGKKSSPPTTRAQQQAGKVSY